MPIRDIFTSQIHDILMAVLDKASSSADTEAKLNGVETSDTISISAIVVSGIEMKTNGE